MWLHAFPNVMVMQNPCFAFLGTGLHHSIGPGRRPRLTRNLSSSKRESDPDGSREMGLAATVPCDVRRNLGRWEP